MNIKNLSTRLIIVLVLSAFGCAAPQQAALAKAQPQLQALAAQNPGQTVRVIAQKMAGAQGVEALAAQLGGRVTADLSFVNAFAAEMTAEAALGTGSLGRCALGFAGCDHGLDGGRRPDRARRVRYGQLQQQ